MKHSGTTIIFVIVGAVVLLAALGVGLWIREIRFQRARIESTKGVEPDKKLTPDWPTPGPGGPGRGQESSAQERARLQEQRAKMIEAMANMSEEEREKFRAQIREKFDAGRPRERRAFPQLSEEEGAKLREQMEAMRERWESMSEQEREEYRAQMRERFGGGPRGEKPVSPDLVPLETAMPKEQEQKTGEERESVPPERSDSAGTE